MALSDIYYQRPWTPSDDTISAANRFTDAMGRLPSSTDLQMQQAKLTAMQQQNAAGLSSAPQTEASPFRKNLALEVMRMTPGYQPGFEEQLAAERAQGGLGAPGPGPTNLTTGQGPAAPAQGQGLSAAPPQVSVSREPMSMNGEPMRRPLVAQAPAPIRPGRPQPQTNADVEAAMGMLPMITASRKPQRPDHEPEKLALEREKFEEKKRQFDLMHKYRNDALAAKERIAASGQKLAQAKSNADRKAALEERKQALDEYRIAATLAGKIYSGMTGIVNDEETAALGRDITTEIDRVQQQLHGLNSQPAPRAKPRAPTAAPKAGGAGGRDTSPMRVKRNGQSGTIEAWEFNPQTDIKL